MHTAVALYAVGPADVFIVLSNSCILKKVSLRTGGAGRWDVWLAPSTWSGGAGRWDVWLAPAAGIPRIIFLSSFCNLKRMSIWDRAIIAKDVAKSRKNVHDCWLHELRTIGGSRLPELRY